jgi:hypothetical protein
MLELTTAGGTFLKEESGDEVRIFVTDPQLAGLGRINDCLVNSDEIKFGKTAAQFETMALSNGNVPGLGQPQSELFTKIMEKGWDPSSQLREILAAKALKAKRFLGADEVLAWLSGEDLNHSKKVSPGEIRVRGLGGILFDDFNHASAYNIEGVARVAGSIDRFPRPEVSGLRKLAERLQFERFKGSAKAKKVPVDHIRRRAGVMQDPNLLCPSIPAFRGIRSSRKSCKEAFGR